MEAEKNSTLTETEQSKEIYDSLRCRVEALLTNGIKGGVHKGGFAYYGNKKTGEDHFVGAGKASPAKPASPGSPASPTRAYTRETIIRFASQSKLLGCLIFVKALEDGLLKVTDSVSDYLPEFKQTLSYYSPDGTTTTEFPGEDVKVSHLMSMSTGLGYYFSSWGRLNTIFGGLTGAPPLPFAEANRTRNAAVRSKLGDNLFWDWQFDTRILKASKAPGFKLPSMKSYVGALTSVPLLFKPGTNSLRGVVYGMDLDVLGAVVSVAIKRGTTFTSTWEYFKSSFLAPMNIQSFFQIGNKEKPAGLSAKLAQTAFARPVGSDATFAPDPSQDYLDNAAGTLVWTSDYPEDGFGYNEDLFTKILVENDPYQGYYGAGYGGTPADYSKFFELIGNKGVFNKQRLLSENSVKFLLTPTLPEYISFGLESFNGDFNNFTSPNADVGKEGLLAFGYNEHWCLGIVKGNTAFVDSLYSKPYMSDTTIRWGSYYGTNYFYDYQTGNFVMAGVQEDANSQQFENKDYESTNWASTIFSWLQNGDAYKCDVVCGTNESMSTVRSLHLTI